MGGGSEGVPHDVADWEGLWRASGGPKLQGDDLAVLAELFCKIDRNHNNILEANELIAFRSALGTSSADWLFDAEPVDDGGGGMLSSIDSLEPSEKEAMAELEPYEWIEFHIAAVASFGMKRWRRALESAAAISRVTRETPEEEQWVVCVDTAGGIMSTWFSRTDMLPEEREACRTLKDTGRWRCLSCQAEDFARASPGILERSVSLQPPPLLPAQLSLERHKSAMATPTAGAGPSPTLLGASASKGKGKRCGSLGEMLSHRALRPVRKRAVVGDRVMIERERGTARKADLGSSGRVTEVYVPEKVVVHEEWCKVITVEADEHIPEHMVVVPLSAVVNLKVPLHPGDIVQVYRPISEGRMRGQRSTETAMATVLSLGSGAPYLMQVSFGGADSVVATIPLSWVLRAEMSAWTQVLRSAPRSTLLFLLCDLCLLPTNSKDREELDDRLRRDFEPHGRCRFVAGRMLNHIGTADESEVEPGSPGPPPLARMSTDSKPAPSSTRAQLSRKGTTWLAIGDCGKIISFDSERLEVVVRPDRKKHMRLKVAISALEPVHDEPEVVVASGFSMMHAFEEDPPLLSAVKRREAKSVRRLLDQLHKDEVVETILENTDADGNTLFHAAVYEKSEEIWKILWSALAQATLECPEIHERALSAVNDWGRSPFWVALESRHLGLCEKLLTVAADVNQPAPVMLGKETDLEWRTVHEFCGGPGLVEEGEDFQVTFFSPICGLKFGHPGGPTKPTDGSFVVVRSFGEAAGACIMAGDVLRKVGDEDASSCATFRQLEQRLTTSARPLTLRFTKGNGLFLRPLHRACELGDDRIVSLLLEKSADVSWRDECGRSALDRAVRLKNRFEGEERAPWERCIAALEEEGATEAGCVNVADADGKLHPFEPPPHWQFCSELRLEGRFALRIEDECGSELIEEMQRVVDRSIGSINSKTATKDRRGERPNKLLVERVQRIENVASYREYLQRRHLLRQALSHSPYGVRAVDNLKCKVNYQILAGSDETSPLEADINEVFLFHGTDPQGAYGIAHQDFLLELAGSVHGDAFGKGLYFAEDCMKSDEYAKEAGPEHVFAGLCPVLLCRVLLGRVTTSVDADLTSEVKEVMSGRFDSLCADRRAAVGTFREFVVFDEDQANADYILWYRRRF